MNRTANTNYLVQGRTTCAWLFILAIVLVSQNSLAQVQAGTQSEIRLELGLNEAKTIKLDNHASKLEIIGTNDGVLTIDAGSSKDNIRRGTSHLVLKSISGLGTIQILGGYLAELEITDVSASNLYVAVKRIGRFVSHSGELNLDRLEIAADDVSLFLIDSEGRISDLTLKIRNSSNVVQLSGIFLTTLKIGGEIRDLATIDSCSIMLPKGWHPERLEITDLKTSMLRISTSQNRSNVARLEAHEAVGAALRVSNITISGQGAFFHLNELPNTSIDLRQIEFKGGENFIIEHGTTSGITGTLVMDRVKGVNELSISYSNGIEELIVADVSTRYMSINLPVERVDNLRRVEIAGLELKDGLDAPSTTLIALAKKNAPPHPQDKRAFFDAIRTFGFHRNSDGSVESPGLKALEQRQLSELRERGYLAVFFGYIIWLLTGFGCSFDVPLMTWISSVLVCGMYYSWKLNSITRLSRLQQGLQASLLFATTFGLPSEATIRKRLEDVSGGVSPRSASATEIALAHFQGLFSVMQLTLLSIYFGQTTLG